MYKRQRYYKFDIPTTVKADVAAGVDIENTAAQVVNYYNPTTKKVETPNKPTQKRVNSVPVQVEFNFTKRLEGRELKANEFSFVLKDSTGKTLETVTNDAAGNVKFSAIEFKKEQAGVHNYTVEEVAGTDATVTYDTMKANVTVTAVSYTHLDVYKRQQSLLLKKVMFLKQQTLFQQIKSSTIPSHLLQHKRNSASQNVWKVRLLKPMPSHSNCLKMAM